VRKKRESEGASPKSRKKQQTKTTTDVVNHTEKKTTIKKKKKEQPKEEHRVESTKVNPWSQEELPSLHLPEGVRETQEGKKTQIITQHSIEREDFCGW